MPSVAHLVPNYLSVKEQAHFCAIAACAARQRPCGLPVLFFHTSSTDFLTASKCGLDEPQFEPPKDVVLMLKNVKLGQSIRIGLVWKFCAPSCQRWSLLLPPDVQHLLRSKVIGSYRWYKNVEGQDKWWFIRLHYSWKLVHEYIAMLLNWIQKFPKSLLILVVLYFCNTMKYVFN